LGTWSGLGRAPQIVERRREMPRSLGHDLKVDCWISESPRVVTWEQVLATVDLAWTGPIRTPSLEVVKVAGDSAVGRDGIQSAPNVRRVHPESAQQHPRRIWRLESEDLGQHLLGRDLELPAIGPDRVLKHFL
jgi:hypothetical protein